MIDIIKCANAEDLPVDTYWVADPQAAAVMQYSRIYRDVTGQRIMVIGITPMPKKPPTYIPKDGRPYVITGSRRSATARDE